MSFKNKELKRKQNYIVEELKTKGSNKQPKSEKYISEEYISKNKLKKK